MSARNLIRTGKRERAQAASRKEWRDRIDNDPYNVTNQKRMQLEDFRKNQMLDEENERKLKEQELKNTGSVNVARTTGEGYAEQQRLRNIGQRDVTGMEQAGLADRARMADALGREKLAGEQYLGLRELEQNPLTPAGYSYIPGFQEYRQDQLGQQDTGEATEGRKYNNVTRDDGNVDYYDREGNLAYTDKPVRTTPNVPGSALQSYGGQSPLTRPASGTTNQRTQRPSFLRDFRDFGSRIGQGFQQSASGTRQRPSSDFDQESQYRKLLNRNY